MHLKKLGYRLLVFIFALIAFAIYYIVVMLEVLAFVLYPKLSSEISDILFDVIKEPADYLIKKGEYED
jgi:hypothetical protein